VIACVIVILSFFLPNGVGLLIFKYNLRFKSLKIKLIPKVFHFFYGFQAHRQIVVIPAGGDGEDDAESGFLGRTDAAYS